MLSEQPGRMLRRADRLRTSREFQNVSRHGQRAASGSFVVLVAPRAVGSEAVSSRIGLTVSRKVGGAVVRNRVKRRLREWFRQSTTRSAGAFDWVVIARPAAAALPNSALCHEIEALCERALAARQ